MGGVNKMLPLNDEGVDKLERALSEAHRSRQEPLLGADWALRVMLDIRREAAGRRHPVEFPGVDRLVWRTAAVAAGFAVVLAGTALVYTGKDAAESTALLSNEFDAATVLIE
jgi:hypothetical protein